MYLNLTQINNTTLLEKIRKCRILKLYFSECENYYYFLIFLTSKKCYYNEIKCARIHFDTVLV